MKTLSDKKIAIVPGSFDPITYGHIDIIRRAAEAFDEVVVAVMINNQKQYLFTLAQRERIVKAAVEGMEHVRVISSEGMLWKLAEDLGACALVKGYRNEVDYRYEQEMAEYNLSHNPNAKTVLLKADPRLDHLSSTVVREVIRAGKDLSGYVPSSVIEEIGKIIPRQI
ncbi:MAG: pantetheine-phosphate adenylyltransferase [Clostridia bacterium]|nr:pantetheine-phosphate adenylyltransferase [Clostridia bacterium]